MLDSTVSYVASDEHVATAKDPSPSPQNAKVRKADQWSQRLRKVQTPYR